MDYLDYCDVGKLQNDKRMMCLQLDYHDTRPLTPHSAKPGDKFTLHFKLVYFKIPNGTKFKKVVTPYHTYIWSETSSQSVFGGKFYAFTANEGRCDIHNKIFGI